MNKNDILIERKISSESLDNANGEYNFNVDANT